MDVIAKYLDNPEAIPWTLGGPFSYGSPYVDAVCWFLFQDGDPEPGSIAQVSFYMVAFCVTPTFEYKKSEKVPPVCGQ